MRRSLLGLFLAAMLSLPACYRKPRPDETPRAVSSEMAAPPASASPPAAAHDPTVAPTGCPDGMAAIPGGTLRPGAPGKEGDPIAIAPFCMDKLEATVARYGKCVDAGKCDEPAPYSHLGRDNYFNWKHAPPRPNYPINGLHGRINAIRMCNFEGKELPNDAQWEWAARGGDNHWDYPWGNARPTEEQANLGGTKFCKVESGTFGLLCDGALPGFGDGRYFETAPVGSLPKGANPWGVVDLVGNVGELTTADVDYRCPSLRGGTFGTTSWKELPSFQRNLAYEVARPDENVGFRCVASLH